MRNQLFRPEAAEGLRPRLEGDVVALNPLSGRIIVGGAALAVLVALAFASVTTYSKYVPASGYLAPREGLVQLVAPTTGDLRKFSVDSSQKVRAGEVLAVVENRKFLGDGSAAASGQKALVASRKSLVGQEAAARIAVMNADAASAEAKARSLEMALAAADGSRTSAIRAMTLAKDQLARNRELAEQGFVSKSSLTTQEQALADREYTLRQTEQTLASLRTDIEAARAAARNARLQVNVTAASTDSAAVALDAESLTLDAAREAAITSPVDGLVVAVPATAGPVSAGVSLFVVAPNGPLYAHILVPETSAAKARLGQKVVLRLSGSSLMDSARGDGVLETLSEGAVVQGEGTSAAAGHLARIKLAPNTDPAFKPGSRVDVRIATETKTLLGWLFDPLTRGMRQLDIGGNSK